VIEKEGLSVAVKDCLEKGRKRVFRRDNSGKTEEKGLPGAVA